MRIVAFSDTHQNTAFLERSVQQALEDGRIDVFIHCGDGVRDVTAVEGMLLRHNPSVRMYAVRGNCDVSASMFPAAELADLNGVRAWITHGHAYHVKHGLGHLAQAAKDLRAEIAFFGHTHQPLMRQKHGVWLLNPGAPAMLSLSDTAYLQVMISDHRDIRSDFIKQRISSR